jgi:hypothetical protein
MDGVTAGLGPRPPAVDMEVVATNSERSFWHLSPAWRDNKKVQARGRWLASGPQVSAHVCMLGGSGVG